MAMLIFPKEMHLNTLRLTRFKKTAIALLILSYRLSASAACSIGSTSETNILTSIVASTGNIGVTLRSNTCIEKNVNVTGGAGETSNRNGTVGKEAVTAGAITVNSSGIITGGAGGSGSGILGVISAAGNGGIAGDAVTANGTNYNNLGTISGGAGGTAGNGGGAGGDGGEGITGNRYTLVNTGSVTGGSGANSTHTESWASIDGKQGGAGGNAASGADFKLTNSGTITGGAAGSGGNAYNSGSGGAAGIAGSGVAGSGFTLTNSGTITGGAAALAGYNITNSSGLLQQNYGDAGVGVLSEGNATIRNSGMISGGAKSTEGYANAVNLLNGGNTLILESGYKFIGNVISAGNDTLVLGGTSDATFDLANVVTASPALSTTGTAAYYGFSNYEKQDSSTWTLSNTTASAINWTIRNGSLKANSSAFTGNITFTADSGASPSVIFSQDSDGTYSGSISGAGALVKEGDSQLTLSGSNSYTGGTTVSAGKLLGNTSSLQGNIVNNATVIFDQADAGVYQGTLSGSGALIKQGTGNLQLSADNSYSGGTTIDAGSLTVKNLNSTGSGAIVNNSNLIYSGVTGEVSNALSGTGSLTATDASTLNFTQSFTQGVVTIDNGSQLNLGSGAALTTSSSTGTVNSGTLTLDNAGSITGDLYNGSDGVIELTETPELTSNIYGALFNSGSIILNPTNHSAGNNLIINGNYTGNAGSSISLGTVLGDDSSLTDSLTITGNSSGSSTVYVTNENGSGGVTANGIKVISIGGNSDADFVLGGRAVAGAYDYKLVKGNISGSETKSWYLTSLATTVPDDNNGGNKPGGNNTGNNDNPASKTAMIRPEAGAYTSNLYLANTLFNLSLRDYLGETGFKNPVTGQMQATSMWFRSVGGHSSLSMPSAGLESQINRFVLQVGGDLVHLTLNGADQLRFGVMGGYGNALGNTVSDITGNSAANQVNGYSAGLYGSWQQNQTNKNGAYVDSWLQYNWFNNAVNGQDLPMENYSSRGLKASLESGYRIQLASWQNRNDISNSWYLEPHAQVIWSGIRASDHTEQNSTQIAGEGNDNVTTRVGFRTFLNGKSVIDKYTVRQFQPYIEANWVHNSTQYGVKMNDDTFSSVGARNIAELKLGVEGQLTTNLSGSIMVAQQVGRDDYRDTVGALQLKYHF